MRNELFRIGPIMVYGYGLMIAIGIMLAYLLAEYRARRIGLDDEAVFGLTCWAVVGGLLGGKSFVLSYNSSADCGQSCYAVPGSCLRFCYLRRFDWRRTGSDSLLPMEKIECFELF